MAAEKNTSDPLETLFVKGDEVNRELLRDALIKFVRLDENGSIFPLISFFRESNRNKVIILLLAQKAISLRTNIVESVTPSQLSKLSDMPEGSLRPTLRLLVDERLVDDEGSRYKIYPYAVARCTEILSKSDIQNDSEKKIKNHSLRRIIPTKISMRECIEDLSRQGGLDNPKSVRDIYELVLQRRPGTDYDAIYKVVLDLVGEQKLVREVKDGIWLYRRQKL